MMTFEDAWPCRLFGRAGKATFDVKSEGEGGGRLYLAYALRAGIFADWLCCDSLSLQDHVLRKGKRQSREAASLRSLFFLSFTRCGERPQ